MGEPHATGERTCRTRLSLSLGTAILPLGFMVYLIFVFQAGWDEPGAPVYRIGGRGSSGAVVLAAALWPRCFRKGTEAGSSSD